MEVFTLLLHDPLKDLRFMRPAITYTQGSCNCSWGSFMSFLRFTCHTDMSLGVMSQPTF